MPFKPPQDVEIGAPRGSRELSAPDHRKVTFSPVEPGMVAGHGGGSLGPHATDEKA